MNCREIKCLVELFKPFIGARLQQVQTTEGLLVLGFYHEQTLSWFISDLKPAAPVAFLMSQLPPLKFKTSPILLFLKAHFLGHRLQDIYMDESGDRIITLKFSGRSLEVRLFPHGQNIIAKTEEKSLSWNRVEELLPLKPIEHQELQLRTNEEIIEEWRGMLKPKPKPQTDLKKILAKKRAALEILSKTLDEDMGHELRQYAHWLQENASKDFPQKWQTFYDNKLSRDENIQVAFGKAKKLDLKKNGVKDRIQKLEIEIKDIENGKSPVAIVPSESRMIEKSKAKAKRILIAGKYELFIGKSGVENLKLLRKSGAQDYWMHLRDYPGAHGILHRNKGQEVSDGDLRLAVQRFVKESAAAKHQLKDGDPVDVVICECRFIKPIKGDKLGRVNYQNERLIRIRFVA